MSTSSPPEAGAGFRWDAAPWAYTLQSDALAAFSHGWTTRQLALRGTPEQEAAAWGQVAAAARSVPANLVRLRQVHGAVVHCPNGTGPLADRPQADGALSHDAPLLLTI